MSRPDQARTWSTPPDVRWILVVAMMAGGYLLIHGFAEGLQVSAQIFPTRTRRLGASVLWVVSFAAFWSYLAIRKPYWRGWGGVKEKLERPKPRHFALLVGAMAYTWTPEIPGILPSPVDRLVELSARRERELGNAFAIDLPRHVSVIKEKLVVINHRYRRMVLEEEQTLKFRAYALPIQLSLRPPTPYAGLTERLDADLPRFDGTLTSRAHELETAGARFRNHALVYRQLIEIEECERTALRSIRVLWEPYAVPRAWTTPIPAVRTWFRYLAHAVYLRSLRELGPALAAIGAAVPDTDRSLAIPGPLTEDERRRFALGLVPGYNQDDARATEVHFGHPALQ